MIEARDLCKRYGPQLVVDGVSFDAGPGEVLGFLGPNGAGKTTTMRMLTGFLAPTSGTIRIGGEAIDTDSVASRARVGYLPEGAPLYGEMRVVDFLQFIARVRRLDGAQRRERLTAVIDRLDLGSVLTQRIETLSKGFRRRVGLAQAILHDPPVLILDEPTDGLDPNQKHEVRQLIGEMRHDKTLIVSTHILEEVHAVCTRVIVIAHGRLQADATPAALAGRSRYRSAVTVRLCRADDLAIAQSRLGGLPGVASVEIEARTLCLTLVPAAGVSLMPEVMVQLSAAGLTIAGIEQEPGRLDEVFRTLTGRADA